MSRNERAFGLYRTLGYGVEATRRASVLIEDELVHELWMAKLLQTSSS